MTEQITTWSGHEITRLREVWDLVAPTPWKGPINRSVPKALATPAEIKAAVTFHAGGVPEIWSTGTANWLVTGAGYYVWVGA